jgi:hypothetical protein
MAGQVHAVGCRQDAIGSRFYKNNACLSLVGWPAVLTRPGLLSWEGALAFALLTSSSADIVNDTLHSDYRHDD